MSEKRRKSAHLADFPQRRYHGGALLLLTLRLWQVQVAGPEHQRRIQRQSIRPILLNPVRGRMLTAGGEVLVGNRSYDLVLEMRQPGRRDKTMNYVMACLPPGGSRRQ